MNLIFFGLPGSGKGSVSSYMNEYKSISTGELLRKEVASGSPLGKEIDELISKGQFVSDDMALSVIKANMEVGKNYIFDGFPRTLKQAEMLSNILAQNETVVVVFHIDKSKIKDRIVNRRSCLDCGKIYNLKFNPPKNESLCDTCGVKLFHRTDDKEDVLESRLALYETNSNPIVNYYKDYTVLTINANQEIDLVVKELLVKLKLLESGVTFL